MSSLSGLESRTVSGSRGQYGLCARARPQSFLLRLREPNNLQDVIPPTRLHYMRETIWAPPCFDTGMAVRQLALEAPGHAAGAVPPRYRGAGGFEWTHC